MFAESAELLVIKQPMTKLCTSVFKYARLYKGGMSHGCESSDSANSVSFVDGTCRSSSLSSSTASSRRMTASSAAALASTNSMSWRPLSSLL